MALKVNLGCGRDVRPDYFNIDNIPFEGVDAVHDLNQMPWPVVGAGTDEILAYDVIEHLDCGLVAFMDECHRILRPGGVLRIRVPSPDHPQVWADPTHKRPYTVESFSYFTVNGKWQEKYRYTTKLWHEQAVRKQPDGNIHAALIKPQRGM